MRQFQTSFSPAADPLADEMINRIMTKLEAARPDASLAGLAQVYHAWCQHVPFDNVRKLIHVHSGDIGPLPGSTAEDFFNAWLRHGTGGTCWAGSNALHALLSALGFPAERGIATMLVAPHLPPNHGTVMVVMEGQRYLLDASILHGEPLALDEQHETAVSHPAWGVTCAPREGRWHINWRPIHRTDGFECRLECTGSSGPDHRAFYEKTRDWSPFNYELVARRNGGNEVEGHAYGKWTTIKNDGTVVTTAPSVDERNHRLVTQLGLSEEIVARLPPDSPTPPPPGSKTAAVPDT